MNSAQKEKLEKMVLDIESGGVQLIRNQYFDLENGENPLAGACCVIGYMALETSKAGTLDLNAFLERNKQAVWNLPLKLREGLIEAYGLPENELVELQAVNDEAPETARIGAVLSFLKEKIEA